MNAKNSDFCIIQGFKFAFNYKGKADQREEKNAHIIFVYVVFLQIICSELCIGTYFKHFWIISGTY